MDSVRQSREHKNRFDLRKKEKKNLDKNDGKRKSAFLES